MKIAFITGSIGFAGAAKMLCFVAESLAKRGHEVHIINLKTAADGKIAERSLDQKIKMHLAEAEGGRGLRRFRQMQKVNRIAKEIGAELLVGFTTYPNLFAAIVGKQLHIPSVMSERGDPNRTFTKRVVDKMIIQIINTCTGGVFQTGGAQAFYGKHLRDKGVVIPNPIFVKGEVPDVAYADRKKTVVSVGNLVKIQKRYDVMLKAFKIFSDKHPEYTLKMYGDGPDKEIIEAWVDELGVTERVRFMGLTKQPMQDIAEDGMFLITSDYEGISNALLEAMAAGLPCVSTDHTPGGARLLITDHEDGLLAPVADAEKLAEAMCEFAENPALAEKCGENAKRVLQRFDPKRIIDMWENYCISLVKKHHSCK